MSAETAVREALAAVKEVTDLHKQEVGTHFESCWKHHAACLAVLITDILDAPKEAA